MLRDRVGSSSTVMPFIRIFFAVTFVFDGERQVMLIKSRVSLPVGSVQHVLLLPIK
jgi:hypothetical protein